MCVRLPYISVQMHGPQSVPKARLLELAHVFAVAIPPDAGKEVGPKLGPTPHSRFLVKPSTKASRSVVSLTRPP